MYYNCNIAMMKGVDVMSYAKGISRKDKKKYLKDVQKNLRLLYSQENVNDIVKIMNSSIDDFIQNNPLSTLNDFKTYISFTNAIASHTKRQSLLFLPNEIRLCLSPVILFFF